MLTRRTILRMACSAPLCACASNAWSATPTDAELAALPLCTEITMSNIELAFDIAIDENPENNPAPRGEPRTEAISLLAKKWNKRRKILNVDFLSEPSYIDKIIKYARAWEDFMGIKFQFGQTKPDILVGFYPGGSWSYVGTDSTYYASRGQQTMNFGWFGNNTADSEFSRTTIHEFGHALSLVHEHSHPTGKISWNEPAVFAYYAKQGWSKDQVRSQVFKKYLLSQVNGSTYDPKSIMHYAIPPQLVLNPADAVGWNTSLSASDKTVIGSIYPASSTSLPPT